MIAWKSNLPIIRQSVYYWRLISTQLLYFDHYALKRTRFIIPKPKRVMGYQSQLAKLYNKHKDKRCFIIANGPSLANMDVEFLKNEITIGCNGLYKNFEKWGFHTNYLVFEDIEQFEIRAPELKNVQGPIKMAAIYNSYALSDRSEWIFFNSPRCMTNELFYWDEMELYPQFSSDFSSIVHLGGSVTYIMLQLAYFLGCNEVYLLGLDHNYGKLPELFPPGKIEITEENYHLVQECHFDKNYYKIGNVIGVPWIKKQEQAYEKALEVFNKAGRKIINLSEGSMLNVFAKAHYTSVLK